MIRRSAAKRRVRLFIRSKAAHKISGEAAKNKNKNNFSEGKTKRTVRLAASLFASQNYLYDYFLLDIYLTNLWKGIKLRYLTIVGGDKTLEWHNHSRQCSGGTLTILT